MSNQNDFVIENGVLKEYNGTDAVVVVPEGVTSIGDSAFSGCKSLTSITLPKGLTSIGDWAFNGCTGLTSVTIPDSVTRIGLWAFNGCTGLTRVYISDLAAWCGISFYEYASNPLYYTHTIYLNGELVTALTIPDGVTSIGAWAFYGCTGLTSVTIPDGVTSIGKGAFEGCTGLTSVTLPEGLTSIGNTVFYSCESLTNITLPEGLTSIGRWAFENCESLTNITLPEGLTSIGDRAFSGCRSLTGVTLPEGLTSIGYRTFSGCSSLTGVTLAEGLTSIGEEAFFYCKSLKKIAFPASLKKVGKWAFAGCKNLVSVSGGGAITYGKEAFGEDVWLFNSCKELKYTPEMFKNAGQLPDIFAGHLNVCDAEALAWVYIYQKGIVWEKALAKVLSAETAPAILAAMAAHIREVKSPKKAATVAAAFVRANKLLLSGEGIAELLDALRSKKQAALADELAADLAVTAALHLEEKPAAETDEQVLPDGTILYGKVEAPLAVGSRFPFGTSGGLWRILQIDEKKQIILVIAEDVICERTYHNTFNSVTWEKGDIRKWLNGEFFNTTFSEEERAAIIESEIENPDTPKYHTKGGNSTKDRIFLLSIDEATRYFKTDADRATGAWWWLRSPGHDEDFAAIVSDDGSPDDSFFGVDSKEGIRPAFYLNPESEIFKSLLSKNQNGEQTIALPMLRINAGEVLWANPNARQIVLPPYVKMLGAGVFRRCQNLQSVTLPDSLMSIGEEAFCGCKIILTALPASLAMKNIEKNAFAGCGGLSLQIGDQKTRADFLKKHGFSAAFLKTAEENSILPFADVLPAVLGPVLAYTFGDVEKKEFKKAALETYVKNPAAEDAAAKLDHKKLMALLKLFTEQDAPKVAARWYAPYAAYSNEEELAALLAKMKEWEKDKAKKEQLIRVRGAVLLNDTVTAMRYADSLGLLERYAELRGLDADAMRDKTISDFGLDLAGRRTWTLAGKTLTATLNNDLTFTLTDETGKELKSVPKKGAPEEEYALANKEFAALKKDVKSTAKTRNDKIFANFLSGRARPAKAWASGYLGNAVLIALARLIVWAQGENTFTLKETGELITVDGAAYTLTDEPVKVAHPMEMSKEEVEAWQNYFTDKSLKQPFEQVWEPVTDASLVKPGRYDGCTVPLYTLMNKEKHGIIMEGKSRITLKDCSADLLYIQGHHDWVNNEFEVKNFKFKTYTRQVNHIVMHLDKATVAGLVKKDDASAAKWFDRFTLAQIQGFIDLANENKATNVLALLLEYKNTHFADFDPMDEFTLEW